jgi:hypothetical protein
MPETASFSSSSKEVAVLIRFLIHPNMFGWCSYFDSIQFWNQAFMSFLNGSFIIEK